MTTHVLQNYKLFLLRYYFQKCMCLLWHKWSSVERVKLHSEHVINPHYLLVNVMVFKLCCHNIISANSQHCKFMSMSPYPCISLFHFSQNNWLQLYNEKMAINDSIFSWADRVKKKSASAHCNLNSLIQWEMVLKARWTFLDDLHHTTPDVRHSEAVAISGLGSLTPWKTKTPPRL